jgi:hypothetical protein
MYFMKSAALLIFILASFPASAQEYLAPLLENNSLKKALVSSPPKNPAKPTRRTFPFFEDFTQDDVFPSPLQWTDRYVYINNTMTEHQRSRGVATFDALNQDGVPYDTLVSYNQVNADSLTSVPIDLSGFSPSDSVYLSFLYQPKGLGFAPKATDSLMLFLLPSNGIWRKVWAVTGTTLTSFRQVMIPITDTGYFNSGFQLRWVNKATMGISNAHWHLDYIRIDKDRHIRDTAIQDMAFTYPPTPILNDFTAMPYRHFSTNPSGFLANNHAPTLYNNGTTAQQVATGYQAKVLPAGTLLGSGNNTTTVFPYEHIASPFSIYNTGTFDPAGKLTFENKYYCSSSYPGEAKANDTIVYRQEFDNYFAYDDGSAEQSYFLKLLDNAPGMTAVEYALYTPDTLRGIAIQFARQVPSAAQKEFAIGVYRSIGLNGGTDELIYREDFLFPEYGNTDDAWTHYAFEQPVLLNTGIFYIAIIQPAGGLSDSLYIALDKNRKGANHRYYNIEGVWESSQLDGALMLRPLVGSPLPPTHIPVIPEVVPEWSIAPNPSSDHIRLSIPQMDNNNTLFEYTITDVLGRNVLQGKVHPNETISLQTLRKGTYFLRLKDASGKEFIPRNCKKSQL